MADVLIHQGDGVIELNGTNNGPTTVRKSNSALPMVGIMVSGTTAGEFQVKVNETTLSIVTAAAKLTEYIPFRLGVNTVELVDAPTGGSAYLFLDQMP